MVDGQAVRPVGIDKQVDTTSINLDLVRTLVPLKVMTDSHLTELLKGVQVESVFCAQVLFEAGAFDAQHVYLLHGDVVLIDKEGSETLVEGHSSLMPLAQQQPRSCRAVARSDCSILRIDSERLDKLLSWSQIAEYLLVDIAYQPDLDEDVDWMKSVLRSNLFFKVPPINVDGIFSRLKTVLVDAGEIIIRQGEVGDGCYFIKEGVAKVSCTDETGVSQWLADIAPGRCFGEDALVNKTLRNATVTMKTDGVLMRLEKQDFIYLLKEGMVRESSLADLEKGLLASKDAADEGRLVIDVRTQEEYAHSHVRQAINIPLNLLRLKIRLLNKDQAYLLYCDTGRRSRAATDLLAKQGFDVTSLAGGINNIDAPHRAAVMDVSSGYMLRDGQLIQA